MKNHGMCNGFPASQNISLKNEVDFVNFFGLESAENLNYMYMVPWRCAGIPSVICLCFCRTVIIIVGKTGTRIHPAFLRLERLT